MQITILKKVVAPLIIPSEYQEAFRAYGRYMDQEKHCNSVFRANTLKNIFGM
ncbi:hypothetical protein [Helicobacter sp.]|uniref:hypothetical protein n=1 Tax=Helicobacter sp. TaxID=218 RepID=UPI00258C272B|nr:hypothetical protein [Helicobacter sp.]MCI7046825.1 hypothetical protein [Helicobacter sp.]